MKENVVNEQTTKQNRPAIKLFFTYYNKLPNFSLILENEFAKKLFIMCDFINFNALYTFSIIFSLV